MGRKVSPPISLLRFFDFSLCKWGLLGCLLDSEGGDAAATLCLTAGFLAHIYLGLSWVAAGPSHVNVSGTSGQNQATICSALALLIQQVEDTFHIEGYSMLRNGLCALIITAYLSVEQQIPSCSSEVKKHFYCYSHVSRKHLQLH